MNASIIGQMAVSGALMGLVYALIAYGFQLTYATSKSINFGQGELVMVSAFFSLTLTNLGLPYWLMVPGGLLFGALLGLVVERAGVRLALEQKSEGWILLSIIIGLFFFSAAENIWGRDDRPFPTPIPSMSWASMSPASNFRWPWGSLASWGSSSCSSAAPFWARPSRRCPRIVTPRSSWASPPPAR